MKPLRFRLAAAAIATVTLALAAVGCSTPDSEPASTTDDLVATLPTPPISLNPALTNSGSGEFYVDLAYSSLVHATVDGEYEPALAESFEYVGEGNTTFVITLREGVTFSDGEILDSAAVKGYLEYFKQAGGPFGVTVNQIASIETPDDLTVRIELAAPNPDMPLQFSEMGMWGAIVSPAAVADPDSLGTMTAGAGPYMLDPDQSVSGSTYVYVKNPHYFAPDEQRWETVTVNVVPDLNSALQGVITGQSQWTMGVPDQAEAAAGAGLSTATTAAGMVGLFIMDRDGELVAPLADERVRQAMNYAIDRGSIAAAVGGAPLQQIVASGHVGHSTSAESTYSFDPDRARELLAEAGYPDGFTFNAIVGQFDPSVVLVSEAIAEQLSEIGVIMEITTAPTFGDYARQQESGTFATTVAGWGSTTMFTIGQQLVLPTGIVNPFHTSDDEFNALFAKAAGESGDAAVATWESLSESVTRKAWYVPAVELPLYFYSSPDLDTVGDGFQFPNPLHF